MISGTLAGPGYSLVLPPGFTVAESMPALGVYRLLPPGSTPFDLQAYVQIRAVQPFELPMLLQNIYAFENPMVMQQNAAGLGLMNVTGMMPVRQEQFPQGRGHIREFEGLTVMGFPVRVMEIVIEGPQAAVELCVMMNIYRWMEFAGPCLSLIAQLTLAGSAPQQAEVQAVVDEQRDDQVELRMVVAGGETVPLTALPTHYQGNIVVNIGSIVKTGDINGTGIAIGSHTVAKVETTGG
ncbi:MAG TPA: hypothetical protein VIW19_16150 [Gaiellaceae bacterium]